MPESHPQSPVSPGKSRTPVILFLILIAGTEIMSLLSISGLINIPGVRWDIMPALAAALTMLACILPIAAGTARDKRLLPAAIITGVLAFIIANIGLKPWAPSALYSLTAIAAGIAAFAIACKSMRQRQ